MDIKLTITSLSMLILTFFDKMYIFTVFNNRYKCYPRYDFCLSLPYGYYTLLKFVMFLYFSYNSYIIYKCKKISVGFIISSLLAIIYNPFISVILEKSEWMAINFITIFVIIRFSYHQFLDLYNEYQNKKQKEQEKAFEAMENAVFKNLKNIGYTQLLKEMKQNETEKYIKYINTLFLQLCFYNNKENTNLIDKSTLMEDIVKEIFDSKEKD